MGLVNEYLNTVRRDFSGKDLTKKSVKDNPIHQLELWLEEAVNCEILDPNAFVLSTVSKNNKPKSRVVLLRGIENGKLLFYTNYNSDKGLEIANNPNVSMNFLWREIDRQIRIEGTVKKCSSAQSDKYFASRPRGSQIGAWASCQSNVLESREELEKKVAELEQKYKDKEVPRPDFWGGYEITPTIFEFWQGRPSRLHDRIRYTLQNEKWLKSRLSP